MSSRKGNWMQTYSGRQAWPIDLRVEDIDIVDIAHSLSMQCRYNGHCTRFYSVAEHSWLVSHYVSPENALWGLLHDASEAYVTDVPRPLKPFLTDYEHIETLAQTTIAIKFGLNYPIPSEVHAVDTHILRDEKEQVMRRTPHPWGVEFLKPLGVNIQCWTWQTAKAMFLDRFEELAHVAH